MGDLNELAAACERASGPDRDIDSLIKEAIGDSWDYSADWGPRENCRPVGKAYTALLDAALAIVPHGYHWQIGNGVEADGPFAAEYIDQPYAWCSREPTGELVSAATPALALCAAALRARAHQGTPS